MTTTLADQLARLEKKSPLFWLVNGCLLVVFIGAADVATGPEIAFSLFYLIPIGMVAWFSGRSLALAISVFSSVVWFAADVLSGQTYTLPIIGYWNAAVRLAFFVVVSLLLPTLKALDREKSIARMDDLTGAPNRRYLFEAVQTELLRSQRYRRPFTLAFLDLDNFKAVNDRFGHRIGDQVLRVLVTRAGSHLRKTDILGRLGGDEFILLLPETSQEAAQVAVTRIQSALLDEMRQHEWPVTLSIGVLTYVEGAITTDDLLRRADELLYSVKAKGKNGVAFGVCAN